MSSAPRGLSSSVCRGWSRRRGYACLKGFRTSAWDCSSAPWDRSSAGFSGATGALETAGRSKVSVEGSPGPLSNEDRSETQENRPPDRVMLRQALRFGRELGLSVAHLAFDKGLGLRYCISEHLL